jgi:thiol-disulfide isomerase/thioredoxin
MPAGQSRKKRIFIILNVAAALVIVVLLFLHRDRFVAMLYPKGKELLEITTPALTEGHWLNSGPLVLSQLKGKVIVLDFWTFNCMNCRHILPLLNAWNQKFRGDSLIIIGVHTPETKEEENFTSLQAFVNQWKIEYPIVTDNTYQTWNRYKAQFWPTTYLIDKNGTIREFHIGELGLPALEKNIQELLHE